MAQDCLRLAAGTPGLSRIVSARSRIALGLHSIALDAVGWHQACASMYGGLIQI